MNLPDDDVVAFGQKLLSLLETSNFTTSYKYATLLAVLDEVVEGVDEDGRPPRTIRARDVADRVLGFYWDQAKPYTANEPLRQSAMRDLVVKIRALREQHDLPLHISLSQAERRLPDVLGAMRDDVYATVVRNPLPRLQRFGDDQDAREDRFIYDYGWRLEQAPPRRGPFDDSLTFVGSAAEHLLALSGLIRPLVQHAWMAHVASRNPNEVDDSRLAAYLFGADRISLAPVRAPLLEAQAGRCFYCEQERGPWEVDHFLPWARWPSNAIENLVVADQRCNNSKRAALAGSRHLREWWDRTTSSGRRAELTSIASDLHWSTQPDVVQGAARGLYLRQPRGAGLWTPSAVEEADPRLLARLLRNPPTELAADAGR